ncbi:hypothetical protein WN943_000068 [Citrus x changshan-huyou]
MSLLPVLTTVIGGLALPKMKIRPPASACTSVPSNMGFAQGSQHHAEQKLTGNGLSNKVSHLPKRESTFRNFQPSTSDQNGKSYVSVCDRLGKPSDSTPEKCETAQPHHSHVSVCDYLSKPSDNAPEKCVTAQPHHVGVSMIHQKVVKPAEFVASSVEWWTQWERKSCWELQDVKQNLHQIEMEMSKIRSRKVGMNYHCIQVPAGDGNGIERSVFVNISSALLASLEVYDRECLLGTIVEKTTGF